MGKVSGMLRVRVMILLALLLCLIPLSAVAVYATTSFPLNDVLPSVETQDAASMDDIYKLQMIKVRGVDLNGFDKNTLNYTYVMSAADEAAIAGDYAGAVLGVPMDSGSSVIESVQENRVSMYVYRYMDPEGLTYSVTFTKASAGSGSGGRSTDVIIRENNSLTTYAGAAYTKEELTQKTRNSLRAIIAEMLRITDPISAEKAYRELQNTLTALVPILEKTGSDQNLITDISDMTSASRHLVKLIKNNGTIADLTVGYFQKTSGVFGKIDTSSNAGNKLKNSIQLLGIESTHQTGILNAMEDEKTVAGGKASVAFEQTDIVSHLGQSKINFSKVSSAMGVLLGSDNPRKLEYMITLKSDKPDGVTVLDTTLAKGILDTIRGDGAGKLELQLGEAAVSFEPNILDADENNLSFRAAYTPSTGDGIPGGTSAVTGSVVADVSLASEKGPKSSFDYPVLLTIDMTGANLAGFTEANTKKLGLYLLDEETGKWTPVGGNYDPILKTINVFRLHLSKYTVLKTDKTFSDVQNSWAKDDINELLGKGVIKEEMLFTPKGDLTREDFAIWIAKAYGLETTGQELPFKDISKDNPYYKELSAVYSQGLIKGKSATVFDPKGKITRQEMATLISSALVKYEKAKISSSMVTKLNKYPDYAQVAPWAKDRVALINELGIMQGDSRGFRPNDFITREEGAKVLKMIYN